MATRRQEIRRGEGGEQGGLSSQTPAQSELTQTAPPRRTSSTGQRRQENGNGARAGVLKSVNAERLAKGLGWFSIGLGLAELLAPRGIARISGVKGKHTGLIRLLGLREIAHGIGIFAEGRRPAAALWARVGGDALDLACLAAAFASPDSNRARVAFATTNVLAVSALDLLCAQQLSSQKRSKGGTNQVKKSIIINSSPEELYGVWRDFENLPSFMKQLESVRVTGEGRSHWVAQAPAGTSIEWDAVITEDRPNERIAWRSLEGSEVDTSGSVEFERAPGGRGTIVRVEMEYDPPGGVIGEWIAKLTGDDPGQQAQEALRCFKQLMETGEVTVSDGTVWNNGLLTQRPAQPVSSEESAQSRGAGTT